MSSLTKLLTTLTILFTTATAILNGTTITTSFTVALFQPSLSTYSTPFICSGVLIDSTTVLTLAECVTGLSSTDVSIRAGTTQDTYVNSTVSTIHTHPDFSSAELSNDIAVLKSNTKIDAPYAVLGNVTTEKTVRLLGWGPASNDTQSIASAVHQVSVPVVAQADCATKLSPCFELDAQHFCTELSGGKGTAYGDFGGPVLGESGQIVGLISGNPTCAKENGIAVEVAVAKFAEWIDGLMG